MEPCPSPMWSQDVENMRNTVSVPDFDRGGYPKIPQKMGPSMVGHFQERRESWHSRNSMVEGQLQKALQNSSTFEGRLNWRVGGSLVNFIGKNEDKWRVARWMMNCRVQFGLWFAGKDPWLTCFKLPKVRGSVTSRIIRQIVFCIVSGLCVLSWMWYQWYLRWRRFFLKQTCLRFLMICFRRV